MQDDALGTFSTSYTAGSVVKGATILTGFQTGVISPGTTFYDSPMKNWWSIIQILETTGNY